MDARWCGLLTLWSRGITLNEGDGWHIYIIAGEYSEIYLNAEQCKDSGLIFFFLRNYLFFPNDGFGFR